MLSTFYANDSEAHVLIDLSRNKKGATAKPIWENSNSYMRKCKLIHFIIVAGMNLQSAHYNSISI